MLTLFFQALSDLLNLAIGAILLRTGRLAAPEDPARPSEWWLTGATFLFLGTVGAAQSWIAAPRAYFAGAGSSTLELYLRWAPAWNTSRDVVVMMFGALLLSWVIRGRSPSRAATLAFLCAAALLGAALGWSAGSMTVETFARISSWVAFLGAIEALLLGFALLCILVQGRMSRLLWTCIGLYTFHLVLNVIWWSGLAWRWADGWAPPSWAVKLYPVLTYSVIVAVAARGWVLARRGIHAPPLLAPARPRDASMMGWK